MVRFSISLGPVTPFSKPVSSSNECSYVTKEGKEKEGSLRTSERDPFIRRENTEVPIHLLVAKHEQ